MKKLTHRFTVLVTDDHTPSHLTKWKQFAVATSRGAARTELKRAFARSFRFAKITETRLYRGN